MNLELADFDLPERGRKPKSEMTEEQRQRHSDQVAERQRDATARANDITELPPIENEVRRDACRMDLEKYLWEYYRVWFTGPFGVQQKKYIAMCEDIIIAGGTHAQGMARGWGKTRITAGASLWAGSYRHRRFNLMIGATDDLAMKFLTHLKGQANQNEALLADFPEIFFPIRKLKNIAAKCQYQTYQKQPTNINWTMSSITFPTIPGSVASGYRIDTAGLTGAIRGQSFAGPGGVDVRPDLIFLDDPQTKESARSFTQTQDRIDLIDEDIMGLGGPDKTMAVLMPCTVIRKGDLADQFLDRKKRPYWRGLKSGVLDKLPDNMRLWNEYNEVRSEAVAQDKGLGPGNDFYTKHREPMDAGCVSHWPEMFDSKVELSAIQRAMNKYFEVGRRAFMSEYMNDPEALNEGDVYKLDPADVRKRLTGLQRLTVPLGYDFITVGIDVQKRLLWYTVTAWKMDMTGCVIDYGWLPDQPRREFTLDDLHKTLQSESGAIDADLDAAVSWGLMQLGGKILARQYLREDGQEIFITAGQIDTNYRESESAVARFCRTSKWKSILLPAMGLAVLRNRRRISEWPKRDHETHPRPEDRRECEWMVTARKQHGMRECQFDPNHWKSFVNTAFSLPMHSPGSISLYGEQEADHVMFANHITSHYPKIEPFSHTEQVQWTMRPGVSRDDLLDALIASAVAASRHGARLTRERTALPVDKAQSGRRVFSLPGVSR